jgi:nodulation protein E
VATPRRVAITGLGLICGLGNDVAASWAAMQAGHSAIAPIRSVDTAGLKFHQGAELHDFDPAQHFEANRIDLFDRFAQLMIVAAREAVKNSGLKLARGSAHNVAVITGTGAGGMCTADAQFPRSHMHPFTVARTMANAGASHVSMEFGITGPTFTVSTACSSANHAIGQAFWMVRNGQVDVALAGGSESPFSLGILKAWDAMRVVSPETCRPFSENRRGMVLGEGAGMLVLEEFEHARARGAPVHAEIIGFGMSSDACHITQTTTEGPVLAMQAALCDAEIPPETVGYINAHGTGTPLNDPVEAAAIHQVFNHHAPAVSSTKSLHGHALGAAGAIEAVATVLALRDNLLPPTANFSQADPQCDLDIVANESRRAECEHAMSNSFAFGGLNAVLVFRKAA